jgi:K+ transporter
MKDIDKSIRAALAAEDRELFEEYSAEQSLWEMIADSFRGRHRWLMIGMNFNILVFAVLAVITAIQFFNAETTRGMIGWSAGFIVCCLGTMMMKSWWWAQTDKNAIRREIKRMELQVARLATRLRPEDDGKAEA